MEASLYDHVGAGFFEQLVGAFYDVVEHDALLRPMYPDDLEGPRRHLTLFLIQYWGGPGTYQEERGHPRLRLRHVPFPITEGARDAWLVAMQSALAVVRSQLSDEQYEAMTSYFAMAANQLRNV